MTNHCTHTIKNFTTQDKATLSRKSDGMILAVRDGLRVAWGEDPRQQSQRLFVDSIHAQKFLRKLADVDQKAQVEMEYAVATIVETEGDSRIVSASIAELSRIKQ